MAYFHGVYCIENIKNNKKYIGKGRVIDRIIYHKQKLKNNSHPNKELQEEYNIFGEHNFNFYILEECKKELCNEKEIYYISLYKTNKKDNGYNKTPGGDGGTGSRNKRKDSPSRFYGVRISKRKTKNKWHAHTTLKNKFVHIGYFNSETEAAEAYNNYVIYNNLDFPLNNI